MLIEEGELFGFGRRFEDDLAPIRYAVERTQAGHGLHRRLAEGRWEVGPVSVGGLLAGPPPRPPPRQDRHEMLAGSGFGGGHPRPPPGRPPSPPGLSHGPPAG